MQNILKEKIKNKLLSDYYNLFSKDIYLKESDLRSAIEKIWQEIEQYEDKPVSASERERITQEIIEESIGFGPLDDLLKDPLITEIMVNGPNKIYIEREGKTVLTDLKFKSEQHLMHIVQKMLMPTRRRVDELIPYTDLRLADGSRVNIIIPPVSLLGPVITIRKFSKDIKNIEDLIKLETLDQRMADFLIACIKAKVNMLFSGATGSGKTTTLNVLSSYIPEDERIITIEDTSELTLRQEHWVPLEARQAGIEGKGEISIRDLFKNSLRMRPERIIIGEVRGAEALDMLQAICSGHRGSLAVIHANSPEDAISRIETMILTTEGEIGLLGIRRQIVSAIDIIVQQEQLLDGKRKITHITEVRELKDNEVHIEDIFTYEIEKVDAQGNVLGAWKASGIKPLFLPMLKKLGIALSEEIFNKD